MVNRKSYKLTFPKSLKKRPFNETVVQLTPGQAKRVAKWHAAWRKRMLSHGLFAGYAISTVGYGLWVWLVL